MAMYSALILVTSPAGSPTNAATTSGCVNHARMPAKRAQLKIDRKAGTRLTEKTMSNTRGSKLSGVMLNSLASVACACAGSKAGELAGVVKPINANSASDIRIAGPDVQIIAATCWFTVTPPTIEGTRTVVSESGVILSPKYAPEITAPA